MTKQQQQQQQMSRLCSAASFANFEPRALACSACSPPSSYGPHHPQSSPGRNNVPSSRNVNVAYPNKLLPLEDSVCAISGPKGIVCFHNNQPRQPYLVIHHISPSTRNFSLAFQPKSPLENSRNNRQSSPLLLAAGTGSGVLIYDVSGYALSPLITRLNITAVEHQGATSAVTNNNNISTNRNRTMSYSPSLGMGRKKVSYHDREISSSNATEFFLPDLSLDDAPNSNNEDSKQLPLKGLHTSTTQETRCNLWDEVTSICWKHSDQPLLITTSTRELSMWDLRVANKDAHHDKSVSVGISRPTIRYASLSSSSSSPLSSQRHSHSNTDGLQKFVHVSCSHTHPHQVGVMDVSGVVQIYDDRVASDNDKYYTMRAGYKHPALLDMFQAHTAQGVGIESCSARSMDGITATYWITWGRDLEGSHGSDCVAKVWRGKNQNEHNESLLETMVSNSLNNEGGGENNISEAMTQNDNTDLNWRDEANYPDMMLLGDDEPESPCVALSSHSLIHTLQCPVNCVRVCPWPFENTFMTVGPVNNVISSGGWRADLWAIGSKKTSSASTTEQKPKTDVELITSFEGVEDSMSGNLLLSRLIEADDHTSSFLREVDNSYGHLIAAELSFSTSTVDSVAGLKISCLSSSGYLTSHCIPEAVPFKVLSFQQISANSLGGNNGLFTHHQNVRSKPTVFLQSPLQEESAHETDANKESQRRNMTQGSVSDSSFMTEKVIKDFTLGESLPMFLRSAPTLSSPDIWPLDVSNDLMLFELETSIEPSAVPANSASFALSPPLMGSTETQKVRVFDKSLASRIPCPRLCGASFSPGGASPLIIFNNGGISRTWEWFNKDSTNNNSSRRASVASDIAFKRWAPKTYLDLILMNEKSKIAQWGDEEADNTNRADCDVSTSSDTSSSGDEEQYLKESEDYFNQQSLDDNDSKKSDYLRLNGLTRRSSTNSNFSITSSKRNLDQFIVHNSDILSAQVFFTVKFDVLSLNHQSAKLAKLLQLGDWSPLSYDKAICILICQENAAACYEVKEKEKGDVWELLAQVVENDVVSSWDQYGFANGEALGRELVSNLLRYYEKHGDVQMLATMVCVLGRKQGHCGLSRLQSCLPFAQHSNCKLESKQPCSCASLLSCDSQRYINYIRMYGDLLYCWGMLTRRTELLKHLVHFLPFSPRGTHKFGSTNFCGTLELHCGVSEGIGVAPLCPRCQVPANPDTNVCTNCQSYAFHCEICTNSVRGLFVSCFTCGHGGHFEHITDWFKDNIVCPSGCGCKCLLNTYNPQ